MKISYWNQYFAELKGCFDRDWLDDNFQLGDQGKCFKGRTFKLRLSDEGKPEMSIREEEIARA